MATTLFLVRHAAHSRVADTLCGRMPGVALSPPGQAQAEQIAQWLQDEQVNALYTSPLQRCQETAAPLARVLGLKPISDEALVEIDFGEWTGARFAALQNDSRWTRWNARRDDAAAPGGETMAAVRDRVAGRMAELAALYPEGRLLLVSHCDVIRAAMCHLLGLPMQGYERFEIAPGSLSTAVIWPGGGKVLSLNERPRQRIPAA
ncbi:histidine phosphatase family protein [Pseudoroseomonas globiformis]|uniref:Histidine phosphatase family protein n=1 Tax=Teichococcus globiformis TaxID=2307229 RepID=A0ABV7G6W2_9PROT